MCQDFALHFISGTCFDFYISALLFQCYFTDVIYKKTMCYIFLALAGAAPAMNVKIVFVYYGVTKLVNG